MKNLLFGIILIVTVVLTGCENPFEEVTETAEAVAAAQELQTNMDTTTAITDKISNGETITSAEGDSLIAALGNIDTVLKSDIAASVIQNYGGTAITDINNDVLGAINYDTIDTYPELSNLSQSQRDSIASLLQSISTSVQSLS